MCLDPILKFVLDLLRSITKKLVLHEKSNYGISIDLFVHHKSENSHHGGTSVVQFDGTLSELGLFAEGVPSEVKSVTEVSLEFGFSGNILHDEKLKKTDERDDLSKSFLRNGIVSEKSGSTIGDDAIPKEGMASSPKK